MDAGALRPKWQIVCSILLNLAAVILTAISVFSFFYKGGDGNMQVAGFVAFRYFTVDSNVFAAIASVICIIFSVRELNSKKQPPVWARIVHLSATAAVTLTLLTVLLFLGPFIYGYASMFVGVNLFMHLITPVAEIALFVFFDNTQKVRTRTMIFGVLPTVVYGAVYIICAAVLKVWPDFYAFNRGGVMWLSAIIMIAFTAGIALALIAAANAVAKFLKNRDGENKKATKK